MPRLNKSGPDKIHGPGRQSRKARDWQAGRRAEHLAAWWLRLHGYRILARNFRHAGGEVDLLARRGTVLAAVEVKWRPDLGLAAKAISARQKHRIHRAASVFWAGQRDAAALSLRFDALLLAPWRWPHHIRDAWRPET